MSDLCFLCRNNTKNGACTTCSLKAHKKCWSQYLKHTMNVRQRQGLYITSLSYSNDVKCPQCKQTIKQPIKQPIKRMGVKTRSMIKKDKNDVSNIVKDYLNRVDATFSRDNKLLVIIELFEYLYNNMWFIKDNHRFRICVQNKLIEFHKYENWEHASVIYNRMFGTDIPQVYF